MAPGPRRVEEERPRLGVTRIRVVDQPQVEELDQECWGLLNASTTLQEEERGWRRRPGRVTEAGKKKSRG